MNIDILQEIEENLSRSTFFKDITPKSRHALAEICILKNIKNKQILFTEGERGHSLYHCIKGNIQLYKTSADGREIVIKTIKPGEIFAEVILFEENHYPVSARALATGQLYVLPRKQFFCLLESEDFRNDFMCMLMKKQRYLVNQIKHLVIYDVEERFFLYLREQFGEAEQITPVISKKDIAAAIGTTPESLSRLLLRLKNEEKLVWEGKTIHIKPQTWREFKSNLTNQ